MGFFSNIFKKIKKAIKKPLSKIFKGVGKGIAKVAKNVWKGIKGLGSKAVQAYGKFSQKLGPIGMIGLSMAMPYFLGAFSGAGGGLWTGFGKMMGGTVPAIGGPPGMMIKQGLMHSQNPFLSVIGRAGKGIYNAGNFVGGTAKGITQTIGETFKGFASEGTLGEKVSSGFRNLYRGTSEVLTGKAGMGTAQVGYGYSGSGIKTAIKGGSKYLTSTGGVNFGNVNIQNSLYRDVMKKTMASKVSLLDGNAKKYFNATKNYFPGIDDKAAFEYIQNNGVYSSRIGPDTEYLLDFSKSGDFKFTAPMSEYSTGASTNYNFTGDNINNTLKKFKVNTSMGHHGKIAKDAYEMPGDEGGILSKKNITNAALETAKNWFASDSNQQGLIQGTDPNLIIRGANYLGTDIKGSAGGDLLAMVNPELAEQIKRTQHLNIAASSR
jgi:hypothetical protein